MLLKTLFAQTLLEMDWYDRSPLAKALEQHRGKWVHFTRGIAPRKPDPQHVVQPPERPAYWSREGNRNYQRGVARAERMNATKPVPMLRINPNPAHNDPLGIYFYPVDFILSNSERLRGGMQYGQDFTYYYIADINKQGGINLAFVRWPEVEAIAERNGWKQHLDQYRAMTPAEQRAMLPSYAILDHPGSVLWHVVDRLVNSKQITWSKAFAGLKSIEDPNKSIINSHEPDQIVVFDRAMIKIIDQGETKAMSRIGSDYDKPIYWQHALVEVIKAVRGEFGGALVWQKKMPSLTFEFGKVSATLEISTNSYGSETSLSLRYRYGRAEDSMSFRSGDLDKLPSSQIVGQIVDRIKLVAKRKSDLLFTPFVAETDAKMLLSGQIGAQGRYQWKTEITNDVKNSQRMSVSGDLVRTVDEIALRTRVTADISSKSVSFSCAMTVQKNRSPLVNAYTSSFNSTGTIEGDITTLFEEIAVYFPRAFAHYKPYKPGASQNWRERRFNDAEEFEAFKGWLVMNSGLSFGGKMEERFADVIAAYRAYPDKDSLHRDCAYILGQFDEK